MPSRGEGCMAGWLIHPRANFVSDVVGENGVDLFHVEQI